METIHIRRLDPNPNQNIGNMSIPNCFDSLLGVKPKHPCISALSQSQSSYLDPPPSEIPGLNLTQFSVLIPRHLTRALWQQTSKKIKAYCVL